MNTRVRVETQFTAANVVPADGKGLLASTHALAADKAIVAIAGADEQERLRVVLRRDHVFIREANSDSNLVTRRAEWRTVRHHSGNGTPHVGLRNIRLAFQAARSCAPVIVVDSTILHALVLIG